MDFFLLSNMERILAWRAQFCAQMLFEILFCIWLLFNTNRFKIWLGVFIERILAFSYLIGPWYLGSLITFLFNTKIFMIERELRFALSWLKLSAALRSILLFGFGLLTHLTLGSSIVLFIYYASFALLGYILVRKRPLLTPFGAVAAFVQYMSWCIINLTIFRNKMIFRKIFPFMKNSISTNLRHSLWGLVLV